MSIQLIVRLLICWCAQFTFSLSSFTSPLCSYT